MSGSLEGGSADPNLTPILDMVFQLITFFMLVMNFKAAELDLNLQLPVLASAKPLPEHTKGMKFLVLNVEVATECPHAGCGALATLVRTLDENKKTVGYRLKCDHGHETNYPQGAITNGKTCLSIYGHLLGKKSRGKDSLSIDEYLAQESELSLLAAKMTRDEMVKEGKELPDIVVLRADTTCRFGAVNYIINACQAQGYRTFALKTMRKSID